MKYMLSWFERAAAKQTEVCHELLSLQAVSALPDWSLEMVQTDGPR